MAKKEENTEETIKVFKHTRTLKCNLTDAELLEKAAALTRTIDEQISLENEKKAIVASFKAKIDQATAAVADLNNIVRNKCDYRAVDCEETRDAAKGTVVVVRLDTSELIVERKMTQDERQGSLGFGEGN